MKTTNKNKPEKNVAPEVLREIPINEQEVLPVPEKLVQKQEFMQDKAEQQRIRAQIEAMDVPEDVKAQLKTHASDLSDLGAEQTIQSLLSLAKSKGVVFSVNVARQMNDPYILDTFHDALAKEGYYKEFLK